MADRPDRMNDLILDSIEEGVFTVDRESRITSFNRAAERITGWSRDEALGMRCWEVFRSDLCGPDCPLHRTMAGEEPRSEVPVRVLDRAMEELPIRISTAALRGEDGEVVGGVEIFRDTSELEALRRELHGTHVFEDIVGVSAPMQALFRMLPDVARSDVPVLVRGPSGSGKEMVAQALHRLSDRAEGPFVRVNCGALPDTLLESELFGHRRGAFTDARRDHVGRFVEADGGTLFLDEIGDTSPAFQVKLLRALEEGEVRPLGAERSVPVDVRVVSATHRDLARMVAEGRFREDLYYRLRVVELVLPPLSERREDIPPLVEHLLGRIALRRGIPVPAVSPAAMEALRRASYPGNVRQLRNALEHALVLSRGGAIRPEHLPAELRARPRSSPRGLRRGPPLHVDPATLDPEAREVWEALATHRWNRSAAAAALGMSRSTLWRRMRDWGWLSAEEEAGGDGAS